MVLLVILRFVGPNTVLGPVTCVELEVLMDIL